MAEIMYIEIDKHEPAWAKIPDIWKNKKGEIILSEESNMREGDYRLYRDDLHTVIIERKEISDLMGSIADGRVFQQVARLAELAKDPDTFCYVLVTGKIRAQDQKMVTRRGVTKWDLASINGAICEIQEVGVTVAFGDDANLAQTLITIAERNHSGVRVTPKRDIALISEAAAFLTGLPGIGEKRAIQIMEMANSNISHALIWLTDTDAGDKGWHAIKRKAKEFLGLADNETLEISRHDKKE